jgi:hypothetical protein
MYTLVKFPHSNTVGNFIEYANTYSLWLTRWEVNIIEYANTYKVVLCVL